MHWLIDFDDTLVMGPNTYAFQVVLPDLITTHNLPYDAARFDQVMLDAQKRANEDDDDQALLDEVFSRLGWPTGLQGELMQRVFNDYQPDLFPDALPFLDRMHARGHNLYIISNNNHAPKLLAQLGIAGYFARIITPENSNATPKPDAAMWRVLQQTHPIDPDTVAMIGDDPWSDGAFAQHIGIACWIVDRLKRYGTLREQMSHFFVHDLRRIGAS